MSSAEYLPELTIRYKTYVKNTLVDALNRVFADHPDTTLQHTQASGEFSRVEADYPRVLVRFYERELFNAGVGHEEIMQLQGESDSAEISVVVPDSNQVQLTWPKVTNATSYVVYRTANAQEDDPTHGDFSVPVDAFSVSTHSFTDLGQAGELHGYPTTITASLATPTPTAVVAPGGQLAGTYFYRVTAVAPSEAVRFGHYFYNADIEFGIYGLTSLDRDQIADTIVQVIAMGKLEEYTNRFYDRIYPTLDLYPDSYWNFLNINSDRIQGFGESESQVPWGAEDDLLYSTSYRVGVFGEIYSLPPKVTWAVVQQITQYPYISGIDPVPTGDPASVDVPWESNSAPF